MTNFKLNYLTLPIYELDDAGAIKPNVLFHRPWDKLHSRCIEFPFAASQIADADCILDVGTVKAGAAWISWLEGLPLEVHAVDYDRPDKSFKNIRFHQSDVRSLDIEDNKFDKILAVSVIEHIGLESPQVVSDQLPDVDREGDVAAVRELKRVLKPEGKLIMTLPFGVQEKLTSDNTARVYTRASLKKFDSLLTPVQLDYYEYQYKSKNELYEEYLTAKNLLNLITGKLKKNPLLFALFLKTAFGKTLAKTASPNSSDGFSIDMLPGIVTWRKTPLTNVKAKHRGHIDGVLCGVWKKI